MILPVAISSSSAFAPLASCSGSRVTSLASVDDLLDVGQQLVGVGAHVGDVAGLPQRLLDAVEAGEVLALGSWSPSRPSISGSRSPKLSATGSIRSQ